MRGIAGHTAGVVENACEFEIPREKLAAG